MWFCCFLDPYSHVLLVLPFASGLVQQVYKESPSPHQGQWPTWAFPRLLVSLLQCICSLCIWSKYIFFKNTYFCCSWNKTLRVCLKRAVNFTTLILCGVPFIRVHWELKTAITRSTTSTFLLLLFWSWVFLFLKVSKGTLLLFNDPWRAGSYFGFVRKPLKQNVR